MKISGLVIAILLVGMIVVVSYSFMNSLSETQAYNVTLKATNYSTLYDKIDEMSNSTRDTQQRILNITAKEDKGFFTGTWDVFITTKEVTIGAVKSIGSSIGIGTTLLTQFSNDLGMPPAVTTTLITLLTLGVIGALMFLILKRTW